MQFIVKVYSARGFEPNWWAFGWAHFPVSSYFPFLQRSAKWANSAMIPNSPRISYPSSQTKSSPGWEASVNPVLISPGSPEIRSITNLVMFCIVRFRGLCLLWQTLGWMLISRDACMLCVWSLDGYGLCVRLRVEISWLVLGWFRARAGCLLTRVIG